MSNFSLALRRSLAGLALSVFPFLSAHSQVAGTLGEVWVRDTHITQDLRSFSARTTVIGSEEIRQLGATSVNDAVLRSIGAFSKLNTSGAQDRAIDLRGFGETSASNLVILVDGVRQNESDMDGNNLSWIPIEAVHAIEITRGGSSVMYGEGATGGVINILTRKKGIGQGGQVGARYGTYGQRETQASLGKEIGDWSFLASGFMRHADQHRENFKSNEEALLMQGNWQRDDKSMTLRYASQTLSSGLPGGVSVGDFFNRPRFSYKPLDHGKTNSESWFASFAGILNGWNWVGELTHKRKTVESVYVADRFSTLNNTPTNRFGLRTWKKDRVGNWESGLVMGLDAEDWTQTRNDGSRIDQKMQAVYGKYQLTNLPNGLGGFIGGRRTLADKRASIGIDGGVQDGNSSFEGGLNWLLNQTSQIYLYRGNSFRLANSDEYVCYPIYGTCTANPVNALAPQRSQDMEIGIKTKTENWQQSLRIYQHRINNEIGLDVTNFNNINYDPTVHKGIEWDQSWVLSKKWAIKTQVASRDNRFVSGQYAGNKMPAPENSLQTQLIHAWHQNARLTWVTTWFSAQRMPGDFEATCAEKIPSFVTHDVIFFRQLGQWQLTAGVKNIGDKHYYTVRTRCDSSARSVYPEAGGSFYIGGRYLF